MIAILTPLLYTLGPLAVVLVMAVVFAETGLLLGFFLPGDSLLFLAGALVSSSVIGVPFWVLAVGVCVAAVAGDQLGYLVGRRYGPRVFSRPNSRLFRRENAVRAQHFFIAHGALAVILGRFVPVLRTFVPVVAGVAKMPRRRFTVLNLLGAVVWAAGIVTVGYFFGGIPFVAAHIELITIAIAGVSVIPAAVEILRRRKNSRRRQREELSSDQAGTTMSWQSQIAPALSPGASSYPQRSGNGNLVRSSFQQASRSRAS